MSNPLSVRVTYLITTKNRVQYLERTLQNVREFIEPVDELIIIDGGSTDGTHEVMECNKDIVSLFVSEQDCGEGHAFNKGLFRSRGRYVKPITDDDYFYPESMRRLIDVMEANPQVEAIQCGGEVWDAKTDPPTFVGFRFLPDNVDCTGEAIFTHTGIGLGLIIRRSAIEKTGGVSNNYASVDGDLLCRLIECGCIVRYLDVNLYRWYIHCHSGFNRKKEFARDCLMFDVRLGRRDAVWHLANLLYSSPIGRFSPAVLRGLKGATSPFKWVKRVYGSRKSHNVTDQPDFSADKRWSGRLA